MLRGVARPSLARQADCRSEKCHLPEANRHTSRGRSLSNPTYAVPPMLPDVTLPASLSALLAVVAPCFTAPSFRTFCALACGFLGQTGKRTVCGMLTGAGLSRIWPHDRAHSFFSRARWDPDDLGLAAARLVAAALFQPWAFDWL